MALAMRVAGKEAGKVVKKVLATTEKIGDEDVRRGDGRTIEQTSTAGWKNDDPL